MYRRTTTIDARRACGIVICLVLGLLAQTRPAGADVRVFYIPSGFPGQGLVELTTDVRNPEFCGSGLRGLDLAREALGLGSCSAAPDPSNRPAQPLDVVLLVDDRRLSDELVGLLSPAVLGVQEQMRVVPTYDFFGNSPGTCTGWVMLVGETGFQSARNRPGAEEAWRRGIRHVIENLPRETEEWWDRERAAERDPGEDTRRPSPPTEEPGPDPRPPRERRRRPGEQPSRGEDSGGVTCRLSRATLVDARFMHFMRSSGQAVAVFNAPLGRDEAVACIWQGRASPNTFVLYPDPTDPMRSGEGARHERFVLNPDAVPERRDQLIESMRPAIRQAYRRFLYETAPGLQFPNYVTGAVRSRIEGRLAQLRPGEVAVESYSGPSPYGRILAFMRRDPNNRFELQLWRYRPENEEHYEQYTEAGAHLLRDSAVELNQWMRRYVETERRWPIDRALNEYRQSADHRLRTMMTALIGSGGPSFSVWAGGAFVSSGD